MMPTYLSTNVFTNVGGYVGGYVLNPLLKKPIGLMLLQGL